MACLEPHFPSSDCTPLRENQLVADKVKAVFSQPIHSKGWVQRLSVSLFLPLFPPMLGASRIGCSPLLAVGSSKMRLSSYSCTLDCFPWHADRPGSGILDVTDSCGRTVAASQRSGMESTVSSQQASFSTHVSPGRHAFSGGRGLLWCMIESAC